MTKKPARLIKTTSSQSVTRLAKKPLSPPQKTGYQDLFEYSEIPTVMDDENMTIILVNSAFERLTGYSKKQLEGKDFWPELIEQKDIKMLRSIHRQDQINPSVKKQPPTFHLKNKNGDINEVRVVFSFIPNTNYIITSMIDVTKHASEQREIINNYRLLLNRVEKEKSTTQELHLRVEEKNILLEAIMENTDVSLAYLDKKFNIVMVNSAFVQNSGFGRKQLIGKNHFTLFPSKRHKMIFNQVVKTGKPTRSFRQTFSFPTLPKQGESFWDTTIFPIKNSQGNVQGLVLSLVDVTEDVISDREREALLITLEREQRHSHQIALEAERRANEMDAIFMAMADPLIVFDEKGIAVSANPVTLLTFGFDPVGMSVVDITLKCNGRTFDNQPLNMDNLAVVQALKGKTVISRPQIINNSRNEDVAVLTSASPIISNKTVIGAIITMHDVSERLRLERQKDDFIAIASHELKTPITTLKAFTQLMQRRSTELPTSDWQDYLTRMDNQLNKLSDLVRDLLDVSRIERGTIALKREKFNFDQLIKEIVTDMQRVSHRHKLVLKGSLKKDIWGDKNRINQIITNLILNAIKYSPDANKVLIHILSNQHNAIVKIRDFGIGIGKEDQQKIFERFYRAKGIGGERFPGLGLGLYISSEITKLHGGKMWVKSTLGKGSTFFFSLPLRKNPPK